MKIAKFFLFLFISFSVLPLNVHAASGILGEFSQSLDTTNVPANLTFTVASTDYTFPSATVLALIDEQSRLVSNPNYSSEIENPNLCAYEKSLACQLFFSYQNYGHIQKEYVRSIDTAKLTLFLQNLAQKTDVGPVDPKLQIQDGKVTVFALGSPGIQLDMTQSQKDLTDYLAQGNFQTALTLPFKKTDPTAKIASANDLGVNTLIGEGVSNFVGSSTNRVFNIKRALQQFNGLLIKPGEEFSFIQNLGDVDAEHGYRQELSIVGNATELEFGGGICQVSTTAFRAAINSGLLITARTPHAYPVSYYNPQGMDATVYIPKPDLSFINNTPSYILIETRIVGTQLFFDFYGTSDGRSVKVLGPTITERNPDGSMKTTFTQEVYDKDGNLVRSDVFKSNYDSPAKYPHPDTAASTPPPITEKPKNWSAREWSVYKTAHGM